MNIFFTKIKAGVKNITSEKIDAGGGRFLHVVKETSGWVARVVARRFSRAV